jgi:hypothetical protein
VFAALSRIGPFYLAVGLSDPDCLSTCAGFAGGHVWQSKGECFEPPFELARVRLDATDNEQFSEWGCETFSPASQLAGV